MVDTMTVNAMGKEYLALSAEITRLEKQKEAIKKALIEQGNLETEVYIFDVREVEMNRVVDAGTLVEKLGVAMVEENGLIKQSSYKKLTVKPK